MNIKFKLYQSIYYSYTDARQSPLKKKKKKNPNQKTALLSPKTRVPSVALKFIQHPQQLFKDTNGSMTFS